MKKLDVDLQEEAKKKLVSTIEGLVDDKVVDPGDIFDKMTKMSGKLNRKVNRWLKRDSKKEHIKYENGRKK